jgi:hypothetical protein
MILITCPVQLERSATSILTRLVAGVELALIEQRVAVDYGGGWREGEPWGRSTGIGSVRIGQLCSRQAVDWCDPLRGMR